MVEKKTSRRIFPTGRSACCCLFSNGTSMESPKEEELVKNRLSKQKNERDCQRERQFSNYEYIIFGEIL